MLAWEKFISSLQKEFSSLTLDRWIRPLKIIRFDAANLFLEAPDVLHIEWFEEHIRPRLINRFRNNNLRPIRVHIAAPGLNPKTQKEKKNPPFTLLPDRLEIEYTLEHFLPSPQNEVAYKLLSELVRDRSFFNPIYLYGPKNSGKTHLLTASALRLKNQGKKVFFVRAESFTSHVVQAIRLGHMQQFRQVYREVDALLIDDIDIFARKDATQEEFFHTFNTLHTAGKQLILTASVPPLELKEIEPRLISRFEWGISIRIDKIPTEALLAKKASVWRLSYPPELIQFLSEKFPSNPLLALQALSLRTKTTPTIESAQRLLQDLLSKETEHILTPDKIIRMVATHYGIKPEDLLGKSHERGIVRPRHVAIYLCREKLKLPLQQIGKIFGRDHSTIIASLKQIQLQDPDFQSVLRKTEVT